MFNDQNSHHRCEYNNNIIFPLHLMRSKIPFGFCCALLSFEDERMLNIKDSNFFVEWNLKISIFLNPECVCLYGAKVRKMKNNNKKQKSMKYDEN